MRLKYGSALLALVVCAAGGSAQTFTYPSFDLTNVAAPGFYDLSTLSAQPPTSTNYTGVSVSFSWSFGAGDPWSSEALFALTNAASVQPPTIFYIDPGTGLPGSADTAATTTLTYTGVLDQVYTSGTPLFFVSGQSFTGGGTNANWSSVSITLSNPTVTPPPAESATLGGSVTTPLTAGEVKWYKFNVATAGSYTFDTLGSVLVEDNDTEIGVYNAAGQLVGTNDDIEAGINFLSSLTLTLEPGEYYLAAGGYETTFGGGFNVESLSDYSGTLVINGISPVPEPGFMFAAGLAVFGAARLRLKAK